MNEEIKNKYDTTWKDIVENPDGSINKEQLMRELFDYSTLIYNLSCMYSLASGGTASIPTTDPDVVRQLFQDQLNEMYDIGYQDALDDMKNKV